jgi:hypothetical protein
MNFEEIQKNWQLQQVPQLVDKSTKKALEPSVKDKVKALQRKVIWTNVMMTIVLCLTGAAFVFVLRRAPTPNTPWFDVGLGVLFGAALLSALMQWLKSVPWRNLNADLSSTAYVSKALKSFRFHDTSIRLITPIQMVVSGIGLNIIYLDIFWDASWMLRVAMHVGLIAFMVVVGGLSLYYSRLRYKDLYEPVIKELSELQQQLQEA